MCNRGRFPLSLFRLFALKREQANKSAVLFYEVIGGEGNGVAPSKLF
jgi:hypothetical protein